MLKIDRQTDRLVQTNMQKYRYEKRETERQRGRETERQTDRQSDRQAVRQIGRNTDRQTYRQTDRQTDRQKEKEYSTRNSCGVFLYLHYEFLPYFPSKKGRIVPFERVYFLDYQRRGHSRFAASDRTCVRVQERVSVNACLCMCKVISCVCARVSMSVSARV